MSAERGNDSAGGRTRLRVLQSFRRDPAGDSAIEGEQRCLADPHADRRLFQGEKHAIRMRMSFAKSTRVFF